MLVFRLPASQTVSMFAYILGFATIIMRPSEATVLLVVFALAVFEYRRAARRERIKSG